MENAPQVINTENQVVNFEAYALTAERIQRQVNTILEVMQQVMRDGNHFGKIPGCGDKPALLKPGAEKLSLTFQLAPSYKIKRTDMTAEHREYEVVCTLNQIQNGQVMGQGVGSCSTMESKYRYRKAEQECPKCGKATIIKGKQDYGGGWLCWGKKGGCGAKFKDGDPKIENQDMGRIEYDNPADYYNTILKMAKKRAHVDAILTVTAASDIFTQDVEDMTKEMLNGNQSAGKKKKSSPQKPAKSGSKNQPTPPEDNKNGESEVPVWATELDSMRKAKLFHFGGQNGLDEIELASLCSWYGQGSPLTKDQATNLIGNFETAIEKWKAESA